MSPTSCVGCGGRTYSADGLCRGCVKRIRYGLPEGEWRPNHRGVLVWVPAEQKERA